MTDSSGDAAPDLVDWNLAVSTARRLTRPGPEVSRAEARSVVADLRSLAAEAEGHVRGYTGLYAESGTAPVVVVDRAGWVQANADGMRIVLRPLMAKIATRRAAGAWGPTGGLADVVGPRVTGAETGALFAFLSSKVLGQFDPFWSAPPGSQPPGSVSPGRLLLVAPNVVHVERELGVDPRDFRMWVCLHEETHRVQFTAVPWLRDHVRSEIAAFLDATDIEPAVLAARLRKVLSGLVESLRKGEAADLSLLDLVQSPEQRTVLERLTAVMSLLEGHAEVVMDEVGTDVVPSVAKIREIFQSRRAGSGQLDRLLRRLLGLEAKMRQYRDGAIFVRAVVEQVGMDGFNRVWQSPQQLPRPEEIIDPKAWVTRVHGNPALGPA